MATHIDLMTLKSNGEVEFSENLTLPAAKFIIRQLVAEMFKEYDKTNGKHDSKSESAQDATKHDG